MGNKPIKVIYIKWVTEFHLPTCKGKLQTCFQHTCFESLSDTSGQTTNQIFSVDNCNRTV